MITRFGWMQDKTAAVMDGPAGGQDETTSRDNVLGLFRTWLLACARKNGLDDARARTVMLSIMNGNDRTDGSISLKRAMRPAIHLGGEDAAEAKRIESALEAIRASLAREWNLEVVLKIERDEVSGALAYSLLPLGDEMDVENTITAAGRAEREKDSEMAKQATRIPVRMMRRLAHAKNKKDKSASVPSFPDSPDHRPELAHRLYNLAKPLASKYQLNLERTFGMDEAREWVEASRGVRMNLPLKNREEEALEFYAELAGALAEERSKEKGLLTEPLISAEEGAKKLMVAACPKLPYMMSKKKSKD